MTERTWVSHYIVPCPGNSSCKHCKLGDPHPSQHSFSKLVRDSSVITTSPPNTSYVEPPNTKQINQLRRRKLMGVSFGNLDPVPFDPELDPQPYACFICWSLLHMTRHCQETVTHVYCENCGRRNVLVDKCPRCARGYQEWRKEWRRVDEESREFRRGLNRARRSLKEEDLDEFESMRESSRCEYEEDEIVEIKSAKDDNFSWYDDDYSEYYKDPQNVADSNELFSFMRNQKMEKQIEPELKSFNESESEYYFYDDEEEHENFDNYMVDEEEKDEHFDDYVVDENERSEALYLESYTIRFFLDCLDALKDLSIEMQTSALLNFVATRKKQLRWK